MIIISSAALAAAHLGHVYPRSMCKRYCFIRWPATWDAHECDALLAAELLQKHEGTYRLVDPLPEWAELQLIQYRLALSVPT